MLRKSSVNSSADFFMQTLEERRMLSVAVVDGTLCVRGTDHGDRISVSVDHGQFNVSVNGHTHHFGLEDVTKLKIQARGGNDLVSLDRSVRLHSMVDGGAGDDSMMG